MLAQVRSCGPNGQDWGQLGCVSGTGNSTHICAAQTAIKTLRFSFIKPLLDLYAHLGLFECEEPLSPGCDFHWFLLAGTFPSRPALSTPTSVFKRLCNLHFLKKLYTKETVSPVFGLIAFEEQTPVCAWGTVGGATLVQLGSPAHLLTTADPLIAHLVSSPK